MFTFSVPLCAPVPPLAFAAFSPALPFVSSAAALFFVSSSPCQRGQAGGEGSHHLAESQSTFGSQTPLISMPLILVWRDA